MIRKLLFLLLLCLSWHVCLADDVVDVSHDARFDYQVAKASLHAPDAFPYTGVYLAAPVNPDKEVVLFIHGIDSSPRDWAKVAARLDGSRQQAWFAYYPSGDAVATSGARIAADVLQLMRKHGLTRLVVAAHSMGGLVGWHVVQQLKTQVHIEQFVSVSTPWNGHWGARFGVMFSSHPADSWRDLVPDGPSLKAIWADSLGVPYTLVFTVRDDTGRAMSDGVISLSSQLEVDMEKQANRLVKVVATHTGVLQGTNAATLAALLVPPPSL